MYGDFENDYYHKLAKVLSQCANFLYFLYPTWSLEKMKTGNWKLQKYSTICVFQNWRSKNFSKSRENVCEKYGFKYRFSVNFFNRKKLFQRADLKAIFLKKKSKFLNRALFNAFFNHLPKHSATFSERQKVQAPLVACVKTH